MTSMNWREPLWLLIALLPLLLLFVGVIRAMWSTQGYADKNLLPWVRARQPVRSRITLYIRYLLLMVAWMCFAIALAGPRKIHQVHIQDDTVQHNVMLVVDVSRSMSARDIYPARINRARLELNELIQRVHGIRFGVVVYAAQPHLLLPVTEDRNVLLAFLNRLDTGLLPTEGSDLFRAVDFAGQQLEKNNSQTPGTIVLVTDGDTSLTNNVLQDKHKHLLDELKQKKIKVLALGVASMTGSSILDANRGWLKDGEQLVTSRLNAGLLRTVAISTGGGFVEVTDDDSDVRWLQDRLASGNSEQAVTDKNAMVEWREVYHPWLIAALMLFVLSHMGLRTVSGIAQGIVVLLALPCLLQFVSSEVHASTLESSGSAYRAFVAGQYALAQKRYATVPGYEGRMGEGSSVYQQKLYSEASQQFMLAVLAADSDARRAAALFNLANSYFKSGHYDMALSVYQDVQRYEPEHQATKINLVYAKELSEKVQQDESEIIARRAGRGPAAARAAADIDLSAGSISLGETVGRQEIELTDKNEPVSSVPLALDLAESTASRAGEFDDASWQYDKTSMTDIRNYLQRMETKESVFWKRLFEGEEGFVAPQEQPRTAPGVKPW